MKSTVFALEENVCPIDSQESLHLQIIQIIILIVLMSLTQLKLRKEIKSIQSSLTLYWKVIITAYLIMLKVSIFCLEIKFTFSISVVDSQGYQLKKACGEKAGMSYYSFYPLTINFHSDSSVSKRGFNATWTKSTDVVTGGNIKSPNFPNLYENLGHLVRSQKQFNYFSNSVSRYGS